MIAEICFTADWLNKKRRELRGVDPGLLERALHAFALLGHLAEDLNAVRRVYKLVFDLENSYRGEAFAISDALDDTLQAMSPPPERCLR